MVKVTIPGPELQSQNRVDVNYFFQNEMKSHQSDKDISKKVCVYLYFAKDATFINAKYFRNTSSYHALVLLSVITLHGDHPFKMSAFLGGGASKVGQISRWIVVKNCLREGVKNRENLPPSSMDEPQCEFLCSSLSENSILKESQNFFKRKIGRSKSPNLGLICDGLFNFQYFSINKLNKK